MDQKSDDVLKEKLALYKPLIVIFGVSGLMALALHYGYGLHYMNALMGAFLCFLATLKFFNLSGFVMKFRRYDILAARVPVYGYAYPFIELALGTLYLADTTPIFTNILMLTVMVIGTIGLVQVVRSGKDLSCGCAGAGFNLPVGRVTIFENAVMGGMALLNIIFIVL